MLDTFSLVEHWRRRLDQPAFSLRLYRRLAGAARWLYRMTQPETGDAPVLGANDGARLIPLGDTDYRDYRPAVQLGMALFADRCAYPGEGDWNGPLHFRPSQADALHVDLWVRGDNHLRDAGSYSYNAGDEVTRYFGGTVGHNTIQFDDRDQMPRLSRFLFGDL